MLPSRKRLEEWLAHRGFAARELIELPGDVSLRSYLRVKLRRGGGAVLAYYPTPIRRSCRRFVEAGRLLARAGVRVPAVLAADCRSGLMLLEDLGTATLYDLNGRAWDRISVYLEHAAGLAQRIANLSRERVERLNPPLDEELLLREVRQTWDLFLEPRGLTGAGALALELAGGLRTLCHHLGGGPMAPCHRDFMARNLVPVGAPPALAVLDFQDLRLGPVGYDLACLLNDSLFPPPSLELRLLRGGWLPAIPLEGYHRAAAQRTLKAVGTFEAFAQRGFARHRALIPVTLRRALDHLRKVPETAHLAAELKAIWREALRRTEDRDAGP